jgi:hypothetical protein
VVGAITKPANEELPAMPSAMQIENFFYSVFFEAPVEQTCDSGIAQVHLQGVVSIPMCDREDTHLCRYPAYKMKLQGVSE